MGGRDWRGEDGWFNRQLETTQNIHLWIDTLRSTPHGEERLKQKGLLKRVHPRKLTWIPQNDAIFEAGDTFWKPKTIILGIYVRYIVDKDIPAALEVDSLSLSHLQDLNYVWKVSHHPPFRMIASPGSWEQISHLHLSPGGREHFPAGSFRTGQWVTWPSKIAGDFRCKSLINGTHMGVSKNKGVYPKSSHV